MNSLTWLMRAERWARNPPSPRRVKLVLAVIAVCAALVAVDLTLGWPDALSVEQIGRAPR